MKLIYNLNHWDRNGIEKMRESLKSEILTIIKGIKQVRIIIKNKLNNSNVFFLNNVEIKLPI